jgi:hypothetical protein
MRQKKEVQLERLVEEIVDDLFTDGGNGKRAGRLQMMHRSNREAREFPGSGWAEWAVRDMILKHVQSLCSLCASAAKK